MSSTPTCVCVCLLALAALFAPNSPGQEDLEMRGWDTIPAEELAATFPRVDPHAHAEFTYRELYINDAGSDTTYAYHNRAKIFTEEGVARWDKVDIPYSTGWRVHGIRARVVYPDGAVTVLKSADIFARKIFEAGEFYGHARSFSFPGLRPGCIVEYQWRMERAFWQPTLTVPFRAEWPTWKFDLSIKPYEGLAYSGTSFYVAAEWAKKGGKLSISVDNQPAISEKPMLAPRKDFEPWVYLEYASDIKVLNDEKYWGYRGGALIEINREFVKPKKREVKELAERLFKDHPLDEDKLRAAYDYCANEIVNIQERTEVYTEEEIEKLKKNDNPNDTIKRGYGTRYDINAVFASLASAAGFAAQLAGVENRSEYTYRANGYGGFNLADWVVAIRYGEKWRYFDPGRSFLPFETLDPENVNATTLQTDKKFYYIDKTPEVGPEYSRSVRVATLELNEFGDVSGEIKIQYNGFAGISRKRMFASMTEEEIKDYIEEQEWQTRLPRTSVSGLEVRNGDSREKPLVVRYLVKIPGYADALQKRMILRPSIFEVGKSPLFPDAVRPEPIAFDFPSQTDDQIVFTVPEGFALESERAVNEEANNAIMARRSFSKYEAEEGRLLYRQTFTQKLTLVPAPAYPVLKASYDYISDVDGRSLSLAQAAETLASNP